LRLNSTCHRHRKKFKHNNMSALRWQMHKSTKHRIAWLMSFWALFMLLGWCSRKTIHQIVQHIYMLVQCVWQHIWIQFGTLHTIVTRHLSCEFFLKKTLMIKIMQLFNDFTLQFPFELQPISINKEHCEQTCIGFIHNMFI